MRFKIDENLPQQASADLLRSHKHDVETVHNYPPAQAPGLIVLRPATQSKERVLRLLARTVPVLSAEPIARRLWIVEETRVRIHE